MKLSKSSSKKRAVSKSTAPLFSTRSSVALASAFGLSVVFSLGLHYVSAGVPYSTPPLGSTIPTFTSIQTVGDGSANKGDVQVSGDVRVGGELKPTTGKSLNITSEEKINLNAGEIHAENGDLFVNDIKSTGNLEAVGVKDPKTSVQKDGDVIARGNGVFDNNIIIGKFLMPKLELALGGILRLGASTVISGDLGIQKTDGSNGTAVTTGSITTDGGIKSKNGLLNIQGKEGIFSVGPFETQSLISTAGDIQANFGAITGKSIGKYYCADSNDNESDGQTVTASCASPYDGSAVPSSILVSCSPVGDSASVQLFDNDNGCAVSGNGTYHARAVCFNPLGMGPTGDTCGEKLAITGGIPNIFFSFNQCKIDLDAGNWTSPIPNPSLTPNELNSNVNRAQLAALIYQRLYAAANSDAKDPIALLLPPTPVYSDSAKYGTAVDKLPTASWFKNGAKFALSKGIINYKANNTFAPCDTMSVQEVAVALKNAFYFDYSVDPVTWLNGIVGQTLVPTDAVTVGQANSWATAVWNKTNKMDWNLYPGCISAVASHCTAL